MMCHGYKTGWVMKIVTAVCVLAVLLSSAFADDKPEIFVQLGHSGVQSIVFSSDGKYVLSGGDKAVKLWDVSVGREIRTFAGHVAFVSAAVFSPDERYILSCGMDKKIILWDAVTGKEVKTFLGHTKGVFTAVFSPDGKYAASGSMDKAIKVWDVSSGKEVNTFLGHADTVRSVVFSPDGRYILSGSWDKTIKLWDVSAGKEIRTFVGHAAAINAVVFSPDGKYLLSAGGKDKTVRYWEVESGRELATLRGHTNEVFSVAFSPDGRTAASGSWDRTVKIWDVADTRELKSLSAGEVSVFSVAFSHDGRYLLAGSRNISLWDIAAGKEVKKLEGKVNWVRSVAFSSDGKYALSGNFNGIVNLWEVATGKQIRQFRETTGIVSSLSFSPDNKLILDCRSDGPLKLWDVETGREINQLAGQGAAVFSPDGKLILSGGAGNSLKLWNAETGRESKTFSGHTDKIYSVVFSYDGKYALSGSRDKTLKLWDISSGQEIRTFRGHKYDVNSVAFSPDGRHVLSGSGDNTIKLWDVETGNEVRTWNTFVSSIAFSPDGRFALSGGFDNNPKLWDMATGKRVAIFQGHKLFVYSVVYSSDGKRAITGSGDGTARIWNLDTGKEIAQFIGFTDGEWIVITPEGYYNSSLKGHEQLNIRMDNKVYGIDQFYDVFYRPDIVAAKLKGEDIKPLITLTIDDAIKNPPPEVDFTSVPSDSTTPTVKVCYQANNTGGGIGEVRLFHNGKLIQSDGFYKDVAKTAGKIQLASLDSKSIREDMRSIAIKSKTDISPIASKSKGDIFKDCVEIDAVPGENEVSVSAFNKDNTVQSYMKTSSFKANIKAEESHLYMLIIGTDQYNDQSVNLKYAVKDANDIKDKLLSQSATLYKPENIHAVVLTDKEATKANIQSKITEMAKIIKPADSFVLFVAGHGVLLQNQYFMLTHDFDGNLSDKGMISSNEIVETSKQIKSLSQLFIFDTCHAGGVDYIVSGLYDARMSVLAKKMGLHIYASANDKQAAMDGYEGNGLFTYTLLSGLNNKKEADKNDDGAVSLVELGGFSKQATVDISKEIGHSQTPLIINFGKDQPVYKLQNVR